VSHPGSTPARKVLQHAICYLLSTRSLSPLRIASELSFRQSHLYGCGKRLRSPLRSLPFTPVPLTLQNFAVILVGMLLGPVAGFSAMVLYLAEGAIGLPVFTPHSIGGVAHLLGPNAGYLFSYPLAAATAGWVVRAMKRVTTGFRAGLVAATVASAPIFVLGPVWLAHLLHTTAGATWTMAVAPFLPGEIVKITTAAGIFSSIQRWRQS
jgi:biotin transport system substrate-specific component